MLFNLVGRIVLNNKQAKKGLDEMDRKAKDTSENMTDAFNSIAKGAAVLAGAIAAVGGASYAMVKSFASDADNIEKTSMKLGVTTDAFQELEYAMGQVGVGSSTMERALGRLNQRIGRAAEGNEKYTEALYRLGFSYDEVQDGALEADEVFMRSIDTLHGMESATAQSALASELFGTRMARDLMPAIQAGTLTIEELRDRAHELGGVIGEDSITAGVLFEDTMNSIKFAMSGVTNDLAERMLPAFQQMGDYLIENAPEMRRSVSNAFDKIEVVFSKVWSVIERYPKQALTGFAALVGLVGTAVTVAVGKIVVGWTLAQAATVKAIVVKLAKMTLLIAKYTLMGVMALASAAKVAAAWLIAMGPIGLVIAAVLGLVALIVDNWDTIVEVTQWLWGHIKDIFTKVFDFMKDLFLTFHPLGILIDNWEVVLDFFKGLWDKVGDTVKSAFDFMKDLFLKFHPLGILIDNFDGIVDFFKDSFDKIIEFLGQFSDTFETIWEGLVDIVKLPLKMIVAILNNMLSGFETMINSLADGINNIPKFDVPNWVPKIGGESFGLPKIPTANIPRIPALAKGGTITQSGMTMVGEEGPELLSLNRGASVIPLSGGSVSKGKDTANIYLELDGRTIARVIGEPLVEQIRLRSGVKL